MKIDEIDDEEVQRGISKWLSKSELSCFLDSKKLIDFELTVFDDWHDKTDSLEQRLKKDQEELKKKTNRTPAEEEILNLDINDLITAEDEDFISYEQEVLQMLLIKLYTKFEITLKYLYSQKTGEKLTKAVYKDWKKSFKDNLSIDFNTVDGYFEIEKLRIFNNNYKHSGEYLSKRTSEELFNNHLLDVIKDYLKTETYNNLLAESDKAKFTEKLSLLMVKLELNKDLLINLYQKSYDFLNCIYTQLFE